MTRWHATAIGSLGRPLADAIAPALEAWFDEVWDDSVDPLDLALIASEVVKQIAAERMAFAKYSNRRVSALKGNP